MSPWDIRFEADDARHLFRPSPERVHVSVWTEPDLTEGYVVLRRSHRSIELHPMAPLAGTRFRYWSIEFPLTDPVEISFAFRSSGGLPVYRVPSGVTNAVERLDRWLLDPSSIALVETPEWAQGAVIYQIFPDRFANGDPDLDPPGTAPWSAAPQARRFQGGDLIGIREHLDYLDDLGVDALYLNPIFTSPSTHRYDAVDYYQVDPALGGNEAFRRLVEAAHERGIKVILDASFNHVHPGFFAFRDLATNGPDSPYRNWFQVRDWPMRIVHRPGAEQTPRWMKQWLPVWEEEVGLPIERLDDDGPPVETTYESWYSVPTMPRVDLSDSGARSYFLDVARYWVEEFDIDGWRMDVARYVDPDFWNDFRQAVKAVKPDAYLVAEIFGDTGAWLQGDRFDATMNYSFRSIALRFFATDELDGEALLDEAVRVLAMYPGPVTLANHNLLGSHDTARFLTAADEKLWRLRLATVFQLTFPGAAGLYYGDEVGMSGPNDPGCRGTFPWDRLEDAHPVMETVAELTRLRRRRPSLRKGAFHPILGRRGLVVFERRLGRQSTLVAINRSKSAKSFSAGKNLQIRWGEGTVEKSGVTIPPRSAAILW